MARTHLGPRSGTIPVHILEDFPCSFDKLKKKLVTCTSLVPDLVKLVAEYCSFMRINSSCSGVVEEESLLPYCSLAIVTPVEIAPPISLEFHSPHSNSAIFQLGCQLPAPQTKGPDRARDDTLSSSGIFQPASKSFNNATVGFLPSTSSPVATVMPRSFQLIQIVSEIGRCIFQVSHISVSTLKEPAADVDHYPYALARNINTWVGQNADWLTPACLQDIGFCRRIYENQMPLRLINLTPNEKPRKKKGCTIM